MDSSLNPQDIFLEKNSPDTQWLTIDKLLFKEAYNGDNNNPLTSETLVLDIGLDEVIATDHGLSRDQLRQDLGLPSVASKLEGKPALEKGEIEKLAKTLDRELDLDS